MGIFDSVILHASIELDDFLFNPSHADLRNGQRRLWQTDDLGPSMDTYGILPKLDQSDGNITVRDSQELYLYRRHPPITKWTDKNVGTVPETRPEDILGDADHWRTVRYTGTIEISESTEDTNLYTVAIEIDRGVVQNIEVIDKIQSPVDSVFPPKYMEVIDIENNEATYQGTPVSEIAERYYNGENINIPNNHLGMILTFYQTRMIDGEIPDYDEMLNYENGSAYYKNNSINDWIKRINNDNHNLTEYEEQAIELYAELQRDKEYIDQN